MKSYTDEELVKLYVETQRNTYFEALYGRYSDKVYRKCLSFTKDPARAEDFTHDIFLKIIIKLGSFKEQSRFSTWLYSVTYNHCMDQIRVKKRVDIISDDDAGRFTDYYEDQESEIAEMTVYGLKKAMENLTTDEQCILMMKYQDDFSIRDMAEIMNVTESAVKMRLKRAKDKLRKEIFRDGNSRYTSCFQMDSNKMAFSFLGIGKMHTFPIKATFILFRSELIAECYLVDKI